MIGAQQHSTGLLIFLIVCMVVAVVVWGAALLLIHLSGQEK
ncbi:MAG TPA: hypothetical protein VG265_16540 [Gaiellaceae bacterium]|nr:hypothetical protein [Gaiellaceae bacterium]